MGGNLTVRPDKNEFLLFTMLNVLGLVNRSNPYNLSQPIDIFKDYKSRGYVNNCDHYYPESVLVLTINLQNGCKYRYFYIEYQYISTFLLSLLSIISAIILRASL